jgi:hypothetical protein
MSLKHNRHLLLKSREKCESTRSLFPALQIQITVTGESATFEPEILPSPSNQKPSNQKPSNQKPSNLQTSNPSNQKLSNHPTIQPYTSCKQKKYTIPTISGSTKS